MSQYYFPADATTLAALTNLAGSGATTLGGGVYSRPAIKMLPSSSSERYVMGLPVPSVVDFEVVARVVVNSVYTYAICGVAGRVAGSTSSTVSCYRMATYGASNKSISKYVSGAYTALSVYDGGVANSAGWHWIRFRVQGTSIKAKTWAGEPIDEPGAWDYEGEDSSITASGPVALFAFAAYSSYYAEIGVGTNGDTAPTSAPSGSPPAGTVTIGMITPSTTSASVPYSYSAADQTGFEYRLDGGAAASVGASPATISGLTASTTYAIEIRAVNANGAGAWSASANFTTSAAGDAENPTLTGSVTFASITQTSYTASWPAGSDNVAVTGYEYQIGSTEGAWTDAGNNLSAAITGRTAGTTETFYVRAYDAAGLRSTPAISGEVKLLAATASVTSDEFKNNTGTLLPTVTIPKVWLIPFGTPDYTNLVTNGAGELVISEAWLSGDYLIVTANADGTEVGVSKATAS